jgi:hypothetical protein
MISDRFWQRLTAALSALAFSATLVLLLFAQVAPRSRLLEAGALLGAALLATSIWLHWLEDDGPA